MRNFQDLTADEREKILLEADKRCYRDLAREMDTTVATVRKVTRICRNKPMRIR
jgi:hypothetical protein